MQDAGQQRVWKGGAENDMLFQEGTRKVLGKRRPRRRRTGMGVFAHISCQRFDMYRPRHWMVYYALGGGVSGCRTQRCSQKLTVGNRFSLLGGSTQSSTLLRAPRSSILNARNTPGFRFRAYELAMPVQNIRLHLHRSTISRRPQSRIPFQGTVLEPSFTDPAVSR